MKLFGSLVILFAVHSAYATSFTCKVSKMVDTPAGSFDTVKLEKVQSYTKLTADLPDQSTTDGFSESKDKSKMEAVFSNECDNMYTISFDIVEFKAALKGRVKSIKGTVDAGYEGEEDDIHVLADLDCRVEKK